MKSYIDLHTRLTLDKFKDGTADTRTVNELQELKNFIPEKGGIFVREGITVFTHTPDVTTPPFDPLTDSRCHMVLQFEDYTKLGYNSVSSAVEDPLFIHMAIPNYSGRVTWNTSVYKEGAAALWIENDTALNSDAGNPINDFGLIMNWTGAATAPCPAWFCGGGSDSQTLLLTYWIRPKDTSAAANEEDHVRFGDSGNDFGLLVRHFDNDFQAYWKNSIGAQNQHLITGIMETNVWQFIAVWASFTAGISGAYHYSDNTKVATVTSNTTGTSNQYFRNINTSAQHICIGGGSLIVPGAGGGRYLDASEAGHGMFDYMTYWSEGIPSNNTDMITLVEQIRDLHKA